MNHLKPQGPPGRPCLEENLFKFPDNFHEMSVDSLIKQFTKLFSKKGSKRKRKITSTKAKNPKK
jgi:hypothetical protein